MNATYFAAAILLNQRIYFASHLRQGGLTLARHSACISANSKGRCREIGRIHGYYVATVGERGDWEVVKKYVKNQGKPEDCEQLRLF